MHQGSFEAMSPEDRRTRLVESSIADPGKLARHQYRGTRRALVIDRNPVVQASLEHILAQERYEVEAPQDGASVSYHPGPVLCLVGARDESGLHVFTAPDTAPAILDLPVSRTGERASSGRDGIRAFIPKPFGIADVLRVVWAVGGFDGRRRTRAGEARDGARER
jgi:CheY-like chemotaxis protein